MNEDRVWDWDLVDCFAAGETVAEASERTGVLPEYVEKALRKRMAARATEAKARIADLERNGERQPAVEPARDGLVL